MCGIVGLLLKKPALREQLGELMTPMLVGMTSRGPDSAGVAIFGDAADGRRTSCRCSGAREPRTGSASRPSCAAEFDGKHRAAPRAGQHAVLTTPSPIPTR